MIVAQPLCMVGLSDYFYVTVVDTEKYISSNVHTVDPLLWVVSKSRFFQYSSTLLNRYWDNHAL